MLKYLIAGLIFKIDAPLWTLHENLSDFKTNATEHDIICSVSFEEFYKYNYILKNSDLLVKTSGTSIYNHNNTIVNLSGDKYDIPSCVVASNNYTEWKIYISPEILSTSEQVLVVSIREGILASLREIMIITLSQRGGLLLHSCSILWKEQVIAFSGKSGAGKSTHARLWQDKYGVSILDGDVTACRILSKAPIAYGLPWCGTSGQFMNESGELRAVVFIQQAKNNSIRKLDFKEAYLYLTTRCFLLPLNRELTNDFLNIIHEMASSAEFFLLDCLPDYSAVEMVKECLGLN